MQREKRSGTWQEFMLGVMNMPITKTTDAQHHADDCKKRPKKSSNVSEPHTKKKKLSGAKKIKCTKPNVQEECKKAAKNPAVIAAKTLVVKKLWGKVKHTQKEVGVFGGRDSVGWRDDLPFPVSTSGWGGGRDSDRTHIIQPDLNGGT